MIVLYVSVRKDLLKNAEMEVRTRKVSFERLIHYALWRRFGRTATDKSQVTGANEQPFTSRSYEWNSFSEATSNRCIAIRNKCLTSSNNKNLIVITSKGIY